MIIFLLFCLIACAAAVVAGIVLVVLLATAWDYFRHLGREAHDFDKETPPAWWKNKRGSDPR